MAGAEVKNENRRVGLARSQMPISILVGEACTSLWLKAENNAYSSITEFPRFFTSYSAAGAGMWTIAPSQTTRGYFPFVTGDVFGEFVDHPAGDKHLVFDFEIQRLDGEDRNDLAAAGQLIKAPSMPLFLLIFVALPARMSPGAPHGFFHCLAGQPPDFGDLPRIFGDGVE